MAAIFQLDAAKRPRQLVVTDGFAHQRPQFPVDAVCPAYFKHSAGFNFETVDGIEWFVQRALAAGFLVGAPSYGRPQQKKTDDCQQAFDAIRVHSRFTNSWLYGQDITLDKLSYPMKM